MISDLPQPVHSLSSGKSSAIHSRSSSCSSTYSFISVSSENDMWGGAVTDLTDASENDSSDSENAEAVDRVMERADQYLQIPEDFHGNIRVYTRKIASPKDLIKEAKYIMSEQSHAYTFQVQLGYIIKNVSTQELELFYAAQNTSLLPTSAKIRSRRQGFKVIDKLREIEWDSFFTTPTSGYVVSRLVYARYIIITDSRPLGSCHSEFMKLPLWLKNSRYVIASNQADSRHKLCDNFCFFRAIAEHFFRSGLFQYGKTKSSIKKKMFSIFAEEKGMNMNEQKSFKGILQADIQMVEKLYNLSINVYVFEELAQHSEQYPKGLKGTPIYFSNFEEKESANGQCNLLRVGEHLCYIIDLERALGFLLCPICEQRQIKPHYARHFKMCANRQKRVVGVHQQLEKYHSGKKYQPPLEILEEIELELGRSLPANIKVIDMIVFYDSEAYFQQFDEPQKRGKATYSNSQMHAFLIACASNVPCFETVKLFWLDELGSDFVDHFVEYLIQIADKQEKILRKQLKRLFEKLEGRLAFAEENGNSYGAKRQRELIKKLGNFIKKLPIIGFNSAKFDAKLMRELLLPALYKRWGNSVHIHMKDGRYTRIDTPQLLWLDQMSYLSLATSYDNWVYNTLSARLKAKLPYSWLDNLDKLNYPGLPDYECWYSTLRQSNVLNMEWAAFQSYLKEGLSVEGALASLGLKEPPKPGREVLESLRQYFADQNMKTFKCYLSFYITMDTVPGVKCCEQQSKLFRSTFGINLYRCWPSIPAVAIRDAFKYLENLNVYVPCEENYRLFQSLTPGGQSIIIQMEAIKGLTKIREREFGPEALTCQSIFSLDASLMYGKCMEQTFVGRERVRLAEKGFVAEYTDDRFKFQANAERILAFMAWILKAQMETRVNGGERRSIGARGYQVDGVGHIIDKNGQLSLLFIEIYGHGGHACSLHPEPDDALHPIRRHKNGDRMTYAQVINADEKRIKNLEWEHDTKIMIVEMCVFKRDYEDSTGMFHKDYLQFLKDQPEFDLSKKKLTDQALLEKINEQKIHGFLYADFKCPQWLREKCELFPLIFKHVYIGREDVGPIMREILEKSNLLKTPTRELISAHFGDGLLIASNLVRFYMKMGVEITNIRRFVEYDVTDKLKALVDKACRLRYSASNDHEKVLGNLAKTSVVRFSCYGKMLTNPKRFTNTKLITSDKLIKALYAGPFINCEWVGRLDNEDLYEIKKRPKTLHYSSPIHMGCAVLNSAKLHILSLVHEVLIPNIDPRSFTFFCSMTDSCSIVCSEETMELWLEKHVFPDRREAFEKLKQQYFVKPGNGEEAKRSKFTAGIFKQEWIGSMAIGVSAKCYFISNDENKVVKLSARGVPYSAAKKISGQQFLDVLHKHSPIVLQYEGFNYIIGAMLSEKMSKKAITMFYIKRQLLYDTSTSTLNL